MDQEITLTFTLEPEDYIMRRAALRRWLRVLFVATPLAVVFVVLIVYFESSGKVAWRDMLLGIGIATAVIAVFVIFWALNALLMAPRRMNERFSRSPSLLRPHTVVTATEGVYVTTEESELLLRWPLIERARVTQKMLLLFREKEVLLAIPLRAFTSREISEDFVNVLREHDVELEDRTRKRIGRRRA